MSQSAKTLLEVSNLTMRFGGLLAVDGVSFELHDKEVFAIIGPNGAGKTTVFNCIGGFYRPTGGSIRLDGESIEGKASHVVARKGLVRTFQNVRLFKQLTVLENLLVAQHSLINTSLFSGLFKSRAYRQSEEQAQARAAHWLDLLHLREFANRRPVI